mmetsp:Transcript_22800/g.45823  ORF Transcript_22800/g.45823 Transcript_22800/m.45823 type:complete len:252 (+) Transcript_22800:1417-2172(+)
MLQIKSRHPWGTKRRGRGEKLVAKPKISMKALRKRRRTREQGPKNQKASEPGTKMMMRPSPSRPKRRRKGKGAQNLSTRRPNQTWTRLQQRAKAGRANEVTTTAKMKETRTGVRFQQKTARSPRPRPKGSAERTKPMTKMMMCKIPPNTRLGPTRKTRPIRKIKHSRNIKPKAKNPRASATVLGTRMRRRLLSAPRNGENPGMVKTAMLRTAPVVHPGKKQFPQRACLPDLWRRARNMTSTGLPKLCRPKQ